MTRSHEGTATPARKGAEMAARRGQFPGPPTECLRQAARAPASARTARLPAMARRLRGRHGPCECNKQKNDQVPRPWAVRLVLTYSG